VTCRLADWYTSRGILYRVDAASLIREARHGAGLTQAQLAARAGTSQPAVARYESGEASPSVRTLERLLRAAGQRVRLASEPAGEAADLTNERMQRLRAHRAQIRRAVRQAGARNVRIFGSIVRGQDRPDSDVDLLVDFDVRAHGALPLIRLRRELSQLLNEHVDVVTAELLRPEVAARATAEAVPL
jgi:hypothetical protein